MLLKYVGNKNFLGWSFQSRRCSLKTYMAATKSNLKHKFSLFLESIIKGQFIGWCKMSFTSMET